METFWKILFIVWAILLLTPPVGTIIAVIGFVITACILLATDAHKQHQEWVEKKMTEIAEEKTKTMEDEFKNLFQTSRR